MREFAPKLLNQKSCGCCVVLTYNNTRGRYDHSFRECSTHAAERPKEAETKKQAALKKKMSVEQKKLRAEIKELKEKYAVAMDAILEVLPASALEKLEAGQLSALEKIHLGNPKNPK